MKKKGVLFVILCVIFLLSAAANYTFAQSPLPDIKINGSDAPSTLHLSDTLSISIALNNNGQDDNSDWWLAAVTPYGLYFFTFEGWVTDWLPAYQGSLFSFPLSELMQFPVSSLSSGTYTLYFGIDTYPDGSITFDDVYYDLTTVNVSPVSSGVFSDTDNVYRTGSVVRIDAKEPFGAPSIISGTIRITSASQGYDSGIQELSVNPTFYHWETSNLSPASDYVIDVTLTNATGQITTDNSLCITLMPNPPAINKLVTATDISFPAQGLPVRVVRAYLLDSGFNGPLGFGWAHTYLMHVTESSDGLVKIFNADGSGSFFTPKGDGTYQAPKGNFRTLIKNPDGTYTLRGKSGTEFRFDAVGKLTSIQDRNGNSQTLTYGSNGRVSTITDASGQSTTFTYNADNRISSITDPAGRSISYGYDIDGNLVSVTDNGGFTTTYTYDANHNLTTITDPAGMQMFFTTDAEDRIASVSGVGGNNSQTFEYGVPAANQMTVTDALGNQTILTYDNNALITSITDPSGNTTSMTYDDDLNLTSSKDAAGNQTNLSYDTNGNVLTATDAQGNTVTLTYEPLFSQITSLIDANGNTTSFVYDAKGNLITRDYSNGSREIFSYDVNGNMVSLTDGKENTTTFDYDTHGNLITMTYPDGSAEMFTYDAFGNLNSKTDRMGQTINYAYDLSGRLITKSYPESSSDSFAYDAAGKLLSATDENGVISFNYDSLGRVTQVTYPGGEVVSYGYDAASNRTRLTYPDGMALDYDYDSLNRLTQISNSGQMVAGYTYDQLSRVTRRDLQNGTFSTYSYDRSSRLLELTNSKSTSEIISRFAYTYDNVGNRLTMTALDGLTQYTYDAIHQLTNVIYPDGSTTSYDLDPAGNRISEVVDGNSIDYITNDLNQYTDVDGVSYTYDANGNMTSKTTPSGTTIYTYDFENRLIQVDTITETITYSYDPFGRRISKTTSSGTTNYIHDGFRVVMEKDDTDTIQATYIHGIGIDEVLVMKRDGVDYSYSQDGLGSVTDLTDHSENVVESFNYDAYGIPSNVSSVGNPYLFTGREYEPETGLFYYRARYYDPDIGRFLTHDPIDFDGGVNFYAYVSNNPINIVDPQGLSFNTWWKNFGEGGTWQENLENVRRAGIENVEKAIMLPSFRSRTWGDSGGAPFIELGILTTDILASLKKLTSTAGNSISNDTDGDGVPDHMDIDRDNPDSPYPRDREGCERNALGCTDEDGDGVPDHMDIDRDNPDSPYPRDREGCERNALGCTDEDGDGVPDYQDIDRDNPDSPYPRDREGCERNALGCTDEDGDGIPDYRDDDITAADPTFIQSAHKRSSQNNNSLNISLSDDLNANIIIPSEGSLIRGEVPIFGLAHGENFKKYRVEFGEGKNPSEWFNIYTSTIPQTKKITPDDLDDSLDTTIYGNLATLDTGLKNYVYLPSHPKDHPINFKGTYTIRLVVTGNDGSTVEDRVTVDVANVIPNALGGQVKSKDEKVVLSIPEQAIMDSFRLVLIKPAENKPVASLSKRQVIGNIYEVREPGEQFTKEALLQIAYQKAEIGDTIPNQLGIYGYNSKTKEWEYIDSKRDESGNTVFAKVRKLHSYYALMTSDLTGEGSVLEPALQERSHIQQASTVPFHDHTLVKNTFEDGLGEWSNRDNEVGATVTLDNTATFDETHAVKISNTHVGGDFAVNVITTPFDVREYPLVQFDYRIPPEVKTNILIKVSGRWYDIGFTDDPKELEDKRVNIAHIGDINDIVADDQWHTARFNLYDMLRTKTGNTIVDEMIMADWDVGGYMKLQFGNNKKGATYYVDNFTISHDAIPSLKMAGNTIIVDHFNQKKETNGLGGVTTTFTDSIGGSLRAGFSQEDVEGKGHSHSLELSYDVAQPSSYAGYISSLQNLDLRDYQALTFFINGSEEGQDIVVGLKDQLGYESKVLANHYLPEKMTTTWQKVTIPLVSFTNMRDWSRLENLSLSFENQLHNKGIILIDKIEFQKRITSFMADDFERIDRKNTIGRSHLTFVSGIAAINGQFAKGSPNGIYRLSYGGNIGEINAYASDLKSFSGWKTLLGGVDCSQCEALIFRIRGAEGGENPGIYLDDGNFRWGVDLGKYSAVTTEWQEVTIPLQEFVEYGVDLTHLDELQIVFEGGKMSGTIYLDDIRFGAVAH